MAETAAQPFKLYSKHKVKFILTISVASLVDKTRGRPRVLSYAEANRQRRDLLELATAGFMRLVQVRRAGYTHLLVELNKLLMLTGY